MKEVSKTVKRDFSMYQKQRREYSRLIQKKVDTGECIRIPAVVIDDPKLMDKWRDVLARSESASEAIRTLISNA